MAGDKTNQRMGYSSQPWVRLEKAVAAVACVFGKASSLAELMDAVSEQIAQVPHFFFKSASVGIRVTSGFEE